jgi:alpha-galactosidase
MRRITLATGLALVVAALCGVGPASAKVPAVAATPPMGWNSWNAYQCTDVAGTIEAAAAAIHGSSVPGSAPARGSLQSIGYDYVNSDGCWNDLVGEGTEDSGGSAAYIPGRTPPSPPTEACNVVNGRLPGPGGPGTGAIFVNPYEFPPSSTPASVGYWTASQSNACLNDGIQVVANYVHSLGLKFGIWADDGNNWNCEEVPGSHGFDTEDAHTFASWGVDYVKGDWGCSATSVDPFTGQVGLGSSFSVTDPSSAETMYEALAAAVHADGRPTVFAADGAGITPAADPWLLTDGPSFVNQIRPVSSSDSFSNLTTIVNTDDQYAATYDHPGFWVDGDIMEAGNGGLGQYGDQSEMSLFSELSMPLITSTQLGSGANCTSFETPKHYNGPTLPSVPFYTPPASVSGGTTPAGGVFTAPVGTGAPGTGVPCRLSSYLESVFANRALIRIDQDRLGEAGHVVSFQNNELVLAKPLADGDVAVALFNQGSEPARIATTASAVGLPGARAYGLHDVWSGERTSTTGTIAAWVQAHQTVIYRVSARRRSAAYPPAIELDPSSSATSTEPNGQLIVQASVTNDGSIGVTDVREELNVPAGWSAHETSAPAAKLAPGASTSATFAVTAGAATAPISADPLTAVVNYRAGGPARSVQAGLPVTEISPVSSPYETAEVGGAQSVFGELGSSFAIQSNGTVSTSADEYGAIYDPGSVGPSNTVQATVTSQAGAARGAKAGIVIRNSLSAASPEGVLLYASVGSSTTTVQMAWNSGTGADVTSTSPSSAVVTDPVGLKLVRSGTSYSGYYSTNGGSIWTQVGSTVTVSNATATQDAGTFQASGSTGTSAEADFGAFSVS